jgi:hypothetical protein
MKKIPLLNLRPCQFVLGMKEVDSKISAMQKMSAKELDKYCREHVIPAVMGPGKELYIIDHHHFARACWEVKCEDYRINIIKDLSKLTELDFWDEMIKREWVYLQDQFGLGPHSPSSLPADIRCLSDDPYRSLVWALVDAGSIKKQTTPFFEFKWGAFFRMHLDLCLHSKSDFKRAIKLATKFAKSKAADHLPGYIKRRA